MNPAHRVDLPSVLDAEGDGVALEFHEGFSTMVNLGLLLGWLRENRPDLLGAP